MNILDQQIYMELVDLHSEDRDQKGYYPQILNIKSKIS